MPFPGLRIAGDDNVHGRPEHRPEPSGRPGLAGARRTGEAVEEIVRKPLLAVLSAWHGLAALKNLCDLGAGFGFAPGLGRWGSGNLAAMEKLLAPARPPRALLGVLLAGVVGVETAIAIAFVRRREKLAYGLGITLFGSFALVDEAFRDYGLDETHREILALLLISYLVTERGDPPSP